VFDLDTAIGVQLDAVGQWVGRTRFVTQPLANLYFSFDTTGLGFDQGVWNGPFDPTSGLVRLDDDTYRQLLRAKVILNSWDGSIAEAAESLSLLLNNPSSIVSIVDNQDMTMTVGISGVVPSPLITALLQGGYLPINPEGVGVNYEITSVNAVAIFGFDTENNAISGFDVGAWEGVLGAGPGMVQGLAVASYTSTSVTLSFIAPATGAGPYTYQAQYVQGDGTTGIWQPAGAPTPNTVITVGNLQRGTEYAFEVYAVNPSGPGPVAGPVIQTTAAGGAGIAAIAQSSVMALRASGAVAGALPPSAQATVTIMPLAAVGAILTLRAQGSAVFLGVSASGTATVTTTPQVVINPISGASHTSAVPVSGSTPGFASAPSLQYVLDPVLPAVSGVTETPTSVSVSLSWAADQPIALSNLPAGSVVTATSFSFSLPAMAAGTHTLYVVANGTVVGSTTFTVS
jgi:hypothetical protein